jgi:hypothetical protein
MNMSEFNLLTPTEYAKKIGCSVQNVSFHKNQLYTKEIGGRWFVEDCPANQEVFIRKNNLKKNMK